MDKIWDIKEDNVKVSICVSGKIPLKRKINNLDMKKLINHGKLSWQVINEERCPILSSKSSFNLENKNRTVCINLLGLGGSFNITGIRNWKEFEDYYSKMLNDIKDNCKEILC
jgi:hypothetical protein